MLTFLESSINIFTNLGTCIIIILSFPIIIKKVAKKNTFVFINKIDENLETLRKSNNGKRKARAFVKLLNLNYILVHTLVNKGRKYDDQIQTKRFKHCLTNDFVIKIASLEGRYE